MPAHLESCRCTLLVPLPGGPVPRCVTGPMGLISPALAPPVRTRSRACTHRPGRKGQPHLRSRRIALHHGPESSLLNPRRRSKLHPRPHHPSTAVASLPPLHFRPRAPALRSACRPSRIPEPLYPPSVETDLAALQQRSTITGQNGSPEAHREGDGAPHGRAVCILLLSSSLVRLFGGAQAAAPGRATDEFCFAPAVSLGSAPSLTKITSATLTSRSMDPPSRRTKVGLLATAYTSRTAE